MPWQSLPFDDKSLRYQKILEIKENTNLEKLCNNLPKEFINYFNYVQKLQFQELPDYIFLENLFQNILDREKKIREFVIFLVI